MTFWAVQKRKGHYFIFNTFLRASQTVLLMSTVVPPAMIFYHFSWFALFSVYMFSWFSGNVHYWNQFSDQPLLSSSLLFLPSYSSLLSCKEDVRAFLLYCYLLFSSIVFSKQTHHWHLAVLISASAICLIGFNESKKENFVGKLEKSCNELSSLFSNIFYSQWHWPAENRVSLSSI